LLEPLVDFFFFEQLKVIELGSFFAEYFELKENFRLVFEG
jgi:hypothetical protein